MSQMSTDCIHIFSVTQTLTEDMSSQTTIQTILVNCYVMGKLVIFYIAIVFFNHEFFYQQYLILDTLSRILAGPDICPLVDILSHLKVRGTQ